MVECGSVLEVGSYGVNGSIRPYFNPRVFRNYVGVDLIEGPSVDVVSSGHELDYEDEYFDLSISCECFEHNPFWVDTLKNMIRMTRAGGMVAISCASRGRVEHGTQRAGNPGASPGTSAIGSDYYRNLDERDFTNQIDLSKYFDCFEFSHNHFHRDLYFVGFKKGGDRETARNKLMDIHEEIGGITPYCRHKRGALKTLAKEVALNLPMSAFSRVFQEDAFQNVAIHYREFVKKLAGAPGERWFKEE
jgi:SAM-dependent methyltransferase